MSDESPREPTEATPVEGAGARVLIVEDDPALSALLQSLLETAGYTVDAAADGLSGLARLASPEIDLLLLDLMLPGMNGLELCRRVRTNGPQVYLPIIMVTALNRPEQRHAGFTAGADDYVTKPFSPEELLDRVQVWLQTRQRLKALHSWARQEQEQRSAVELQALVKQAVQAQTHTAMMTAIKMLAAAIEARDPYTGGHVARVGAYAVATARELELPAALHDIGKIGVEDRILRKPGPLDPEELAQMQEHTAVGARILDSVPALEEQDALGLARRCALYHQERYDGLGYPQGLVGSAIPLEARIVAVVDTFDAMTTDRPYRDALPTSVALEEIERGAGTQFDPDVVAAFLRAVANGAIAAPRG